MEEEKKLVLEIVQKVFTNKYYNYDPRQGYDLKKQVAFEHLRKKLTMRVQNQTALLKSMDQANLRKQ